MNKNLIRDIENKLEKVVSEMNENRNIIDKLRKKNYQLNKEKYLEGAIYTILRDKNKIVGEIYVYPDSLSVVTLPWVNSSKLIKEAMHSLSHEYGLKVFGI
ncbi:MAG: hypothetical protein QXD43_00650 [Candidatus Aenigmatarchaeota archaeon]